MKIEMKGMFVVFDDEALASIFDSIYIFCYYLVSILNNHQLSMECSLV